MNANMAKRQGEVSILCQYVVERLKNTGGIFKQTGYVRSGGTIGEYVILIPVSRLSFEKKEDSK